MAITISFSAFAEDLADTIYHNGNIITINDTQPRAEAVAVKDGKILAVGTKENALKSKGDGTRLLDLQGRTMLPGFVDAHGHVMGGGLQALSANLLAPPDGEVKDIASLQHMVCYSLVKGCACQTNYVIYQSPINNCSSHVSSSEKS